MWWWLLGLRKRALGQCSVHMLVWRMASPPAIPGTGLGTSMSPASDGLLVIRFMYRDVYAICQAEVACLGHQGKCVILGHVWLNGSLLCFPTSFSLHVYNFAFC